MLVDTAMSLVAIWCKCDVMQLSPCTQQEPPGKTAVFSPNPMWSRHVTSGITCTQSITTPLQLLAWQRKAKKMWKLRKMWQKRNIRYTPQLWDTNTFNWLEKSDGFQCSMLAHESEHPYMLMPLNSIGTWLMYLCYSVDVLSHCNRFSHYFCYTS